MLFSSNNNKKTFKVETIISTDTVIKGDIKITSGTIRIDGKLEKGSITADGVILGKTGKIKGHITAQKVVIGGEVHGNIKATNSLEVLAGAAIYGDIETSNFMVADGSKFEGKCSMSNITPHNNEASHNLDLKEKEPELI